MKPSHPIPASPARFSATRPSLRSGAVVRTGAALGLLLGPCLALALEADPEKYRRPASFTLTREVVNEDVQPFTATIATVGSRLTNIPFEPKFYRTQFFAAGDADDRVPLSFKDATLYDTVRGAFYDGAEVQVFRVVDGRMKLVRQDGWASE